MEERIKTYYPGFNVLNEQDHWDDHSREIVLKRTEIPGMFQKLTGEEIEQIKAVAALIVDDARSSLLDYIVKHFDNKLQRDIGESQRKPGVPPEKVLIKQGLAALDVLAKNTHGQPFAGCTPEVQVSLLVALENDTTTLQTEDGASIPTKAFFNKMLTEIVSAYYSHPTVWSEIGYAGPAYPRGYVRSELGLTDPWEARKDA